MKSLPDPLSVFVMNCDSVHRLGGAAARARAGKERESASCAGKETGLIQMCFRFSFLSGNYVYPACCHCACQLGVQLAMYSNRRCTAIAA